MPQVDLKRPRFARNKSTNIEHVRSARYNTHILSVQHPIQLIELIRHLNEFQYNAVLWLFTSINGRTYPPVVIT